MSWIPRFVVSMALGLVTLTASAGAFASKAFAVVSGEGREQAGFFVAGDSGAELELSPGIAIEAEPAAELRVMPSTTRLWLGAEGIHRVHIVLVRRGHVRAKIAAGPQRRGLALWSVDRRLAVVTDGRAELVVRDGVEVSANTGGHVLVASGAGWDPLERGKKQRRVHGAAAQPEALLPAPRIVLPRRIAAAFTGPVTLPVEWAKVSGAASYEVTLRAAGKVRAGVSVNGGRRSAELGGIGPGRYIAEVRAVDEDGIGGSRGVSAAAHVLGIELPPGAYVSSDGRVRLAPSQVARVTHCEGLEMAYGTGERFIAATEQVRLYRERPTRVRYRLAGTPQSFAVDLVPQALKADILIGPKSPEFPKDDVHIAVRLIDEYGGRGPVEIEPDIVVTAGIEQLDLRWQTRGEYRYAKVAPVGGVGPWVIRVDVFGPRGRSLGHDFIEVAAGDEPTRVRVIPVAADKDPAAPMASAADRTAGAN